MCEFCERHAGNGQECGKDYPIKPCGNGDLGVRAEYIDGGIILFKDHNIASGYFDINFCPICGRKIDQKNPDGENLIFERKSVMDVKRFDSGEGNVWKYVFTKADMVAEAVLYCYEDFYKRTVICCSTMSGCPVGCKFCGTGNKFVRNLTSAEIIEQIQDVLLDKGIEDVDTIGERFQIMFMSMGEPLLNWDNVSSAIKTLHDLYPNAELLLSTIAPNNRDAWDKLIRLSKDIPNIGLQFSIHKSTDAARNILIPYKDKLTLKEIRDIGIVWWRETGRCPYLNYCIDGTNNTEEDSARLMNLFSPVIFNFTFSVVCSPNESMKDAGFRELSTVRSFEQSFAAQGYNTRIFNPDGQDDIGGGCGQLWYVQKWMKERGSNNK